METLEINCVVLFCILLSSVGCFLSSEPQPRSFAPALLELGLCGPGPAFYKQMKLLG